MTKTGTLYGIGVGPGDPDLLTLKGKKIIESINTIFIPKRSEKDRSYAFSIIKNLVSSEKEIVDLIFPMTKDEKTLDKYWTSASININNKLKLGIDCAIITEGDPFLFSTFIYIFKKIKELNQKADIKVIPGISSINASACNCLTPLAEGNEMVAIIPANYNINKIKDIIAIFDTVVLIKIKNVLHEILNTIKEFDNNIQVILVQKCGTNNELIIHNIEEISKLNPDYFSLMILKKLKVNKTTTI